MVAVAAILDIERNDYRNSDSPGLPNDSHQVSAKPDLPQFIKTFLDKICLFLRNMEPLKW